MAMVLLWLLYLTSKESEHDALVACIFEQSHFPATVCC